MKPFSLETVLRYRKRLEDIAQHRFFEAEKNRTIVEKKLSSEQSNLNKLIATSARLQTKGIDITELIRYENIITRNQENILAIRKTLYEKKILAEKERENLILKSKERQIMERLKEHQNSEWKKFLDKKESAMLDEIAIIHHDMTI